MKTPGGQAALAIAGQTITASVDAADMRGTLRCGDTLIVREVLTATNGNTLLLLIAEDALRDVAAHLLAD